MDRSFRQSLLDLPRYGTVNVHASLLPRWRGAAPIQAAIKAGDCESGATIMLLDAGLDTGPLLAKRALPLAPDETGQSLHDKLSQLGAELLVETLPRYLNGEIEPQEQDDSLATYAPRIKKEEGRIDWTRSAQVDRAHGARLHALARRLHLLGRRAAADSGGQSRRWPR